MKKCINCNGYVKDDDKYCHNCGIMIINSKKYIFIDILNIIFIIGIIFMILLFISSYLVNK